MRDLRVGAEIAKSKFGPNHTEYRNAERTVQAAEMERDAALKSIVERNLTADFKATSTRSRAWPACSSSTRTTSSGSRPG